MENPAAAAAVAQAAARTTVRRVGRLLRLDMERDVDSEREDPTHENAAVATR